MITVIGNVQESDVVFRIESYDPYRFALREFRGVLRGDIFGI